MSLQILTLFFLKLQNTIYFRGQKNFDLKTIFHFVLIWYSKKKKKIIVIGNVVVDCLA